MKRETVHMRRRFAMRHLIAAAEHHYALPKGTIVSGRKTRPIIIPRFMVCLIARRELGLSYPHIGQMIGRDHSTVLHAARTAVVLVESEAYAADYEAIVEDAARRGARWFHAGEVTVEALAPPEVPAPEPTPEPEPRRTPPVLRHDPFADCISPPREWWVENDSRFVEAMRAVHSDREIELEAVA